MYCEAKAKGFSNPKAKAEANKVCAIGHSQLDLAWYASDLNPNPTVFDPSYGALTEEKKNAYVVALRGDGKGGMSWGRIAVVTGETESRVSTRWELAAKLSRTGQRMGKGGRFAFDDARLYVETHKGLGTEATKEELRALRNDPEALQAYMEAAAEYKSKLARKTAAAKRALKK